MQPPNNDAPHIDDILTDLFDRYEPRLDEYQWPIESQRWYELAFAVLEQHGPASAASSACSTLLELGLLEIDIVSAFKDEDHRLATDVLIRTGFAEDRARPALAELAQVAMVLTEEYDGKPQLLLRAAAQQTTAHVTAALLDRGEADGTLEVALERWLQEVLNLPILTVTPPVEEFCRRHDIQPDQLTRSADRLDLNLGIVDDLIDWWYQDEETTPRVAERLHEVGPEVGDV